MLSVIKANLMSISQDIAAIAFTIIGQNGTVSK